MLSLTVMEADPTQPHILRISDDNGMSCSGTRDEGITLCTSSVLESQRFQVILIPSVPVLKTRKPNLFAACRAPVFHKPKQKSRLKQIFGHGLKIEEKLQFLDDVISSCPKSPIGNKKKTFTKKKISVGAVKGYSALTNEGEYACELCSIKFISFTQLYEHLEKHPGKYKWACNACPEGTAIFESFSSLKEHETALHTSELFRCGKCNVPFASVSLLEKHERCVHLEPIKLSCKFCGKVFYKRADLRNHVSIHLNLRQNICEICGQAFNHISNLIRHSRLHSGVKPYPCKICGKRFTQLSSLKEHQIGYHENKPIPCPALPDICKKIFRTPSIAKQHAVRMHPDVKWECLQNTVKKHGRFFHCTVCGETFSKLKDLRNHRLLHEPTTKTSKKDVKKTNITLIKEDIESLESFSANIDTENTQNSMCVSNIVALSCDGTVLKHSIDRNNCDYLKSGTISNARVSDISFCNDDEDKTGFLNRNNSMLRSCSSKQVNTIPVDHDYAYSAFSKLSEKPGNCEEPQNISTNVTDLLPRVEDSTLTLDEGYRSKIGPCKDNEDETGLMSLKDTHVNLLPPDKIIETHGDHNYAFACTDFEDHEISDTICENSHQSSFTSITDPSQGAVPDLDERSENETSCLDSNEDMREHESDNTNIGTPADHDYAHSMKDKAFGKPEMMAYEFSQDNNSLCVKNSYRSSQDIAIVLEEEHSLQYGNEVTCHSDNKTGVDLVNVNINGVDLNLCSSIEVIETPRDHNYAYSVKDLDISKCETRTCESVPDDSFTNPLPIKVEDGSFLLEEGYENEIVLYVSQGNDGLPQEVRLKPLTDSLTISEIDNVQVIDRPKRKGVVKKNARSLLINQSIKKKHCPECGKYFDKASNLKQHLGVHFAHLQRYECEYCGVRYSWKSTLNKHVTAQHLSAPKALCDTCGKQYSTVTQVQEHVRRDHLLLRPHSCQMCPKTFFKKHDLQIHVRVHNKEKPYMCTTCGKNFLHVSHLRRHEFVHFQHYECDTCNTIFSKFSELRRHRKNHFSCRSLSLQNDSCSFDI